MNNRFLGIFGALLMIIVFGVSFATLSGPSPIPNPPTFVVTTNAATLCKGTTNYIPITITNVGNTNPSIGITSLNGTQMQYIEVSLGQSRSLLSAGNGTAYINNVNPHTSKTVYLPIFVSANASLITSAQIDINYYYLVYYSDSEVRNLTFEAQSCGSPLSVDISPKTLASGQIQNLSINLTNNGTTTLNDVYVHYTMPAIDGAVIGNTQTQIGSLASKKSIHISTALFVSRNASIESFPFNISATFYNGSSIEQVVNSTSLLPVGTIDLETSGLTLSPSISTPGSIFSISFILTDIGTSGASAVTVYAKPVAGFTPFGANPTYVGDIGTDSQAPVTVTLTAASTLKSGNYTIPLKINFLNGLRENVSEYMNVSVSVISGNAIGAIGSARGAYVTQKKKSSGLVFFVMVIIIIALIALYYLERKKNRKHNEKK